MAADPKPKDPKQDWKSEAGPIRFYLNDPTVSEIMVNRYDKVFIERSGVIEEAEYTFSSRDAYNRFVHSVAVAVGRELNRRHPLLDGILPDGSRINIVIPPVTSDSPSVTIRKFSRDMLSYKQLITNEYLDEKLVYFLSQAVLGKQNIIISGGTGSGKTTLLNLLTSFIPKKERIVAIEDTPELQIAVKNLVRLEAQTNIGEEEIRIPDLVKNALRMRPDRIIIGECRGEEVWDMFAAMNTGHEGSMSTIHANSAYDAIRRLENLLLRASPNTPHPVIKEDLAHTIDLIIQVERASDGRRRLVEVLEVMGRKDDQYIVKDVFTYSPETGFSSTGHIPKFVRKSNRNGVQFPEHFFDPKYKPTLAE